MPKPFAAANPAALPESVPTFGDVQDALAEVRGLNLAMFMATSSLADLEERRALHTLLECIGRGLDRAQAMVDQMSGAQRPEAFNG